VLDDAGSGRHLRLRRLTHERFARLQNLPDAVLDQLCHRLRDHFRRRQTDEPDWIEAEVRRRDVVAAEIAQIASAERDRDWRGVEDRVEERQVETPAGESHGSRSMSRALGAPSHLTLYRLSPRAG